MLLKVSSVLTFLKVSRSALHSVGPEMANDLSPMALGHRGLFSKSVAVSDLRLLACRMVDGQHFGHVGGGA